MRVAIGILLSMVGLTTSACGNDESRSGPDLPRGWETARVIADVHQTACGGSPYDGTQEAMTASADGRAVHVVYEPAHFRCAQTVQGFAKIAATSIDVLVQPVDMNPATIAKCDCLYGVDMSVPAQSGTYSVTVYRRWDHKSGADEPLKIGIEAVTVP